MCSTSANSSYSSFSASRKIRFVFLSIMQKAHIRFYANRCVLSFTFSDNRCILPPLFRVRCGKPIQNPHQGFPDRMHKIPDHSQPFTGSIAADGQCTISGSFVTLLRTVQFSAVGTLTHGSVSLRMQGERNVFLLTGAASESREEVSL